MKKTEVIKEVLIKIIVILLFLYLILFSIRIGISTDYDTTVVNSVSVASVETEETLEQISDESYESDTETFGTLNNLNFTIDITVVDSDNNMYKGNTATIDGYSGVIEFKLSDSFKDSNDIPIELGNTYIIESSPMMETSYDGFPLVTATNIKLATEEDINKLEEVRASVSTFKRKSIEYNNMTLDDIVQDANTSYATWTQDEVKEYIDFIKNRGYTDGRRYKSYVCLRESIRQVYDR